MNCNDSTLKSILPRPLSFWCACFTAFSGDPCLLFMAGLADTELLALSVKKKTSFLSHLYNFFYKNQKTLLINTFSIHVQCMYCCMEKTTIIFQFTIT